MKQEEDTELLGCFTSLWESSGAPFEHFVPDEEVSMIAAALTTQFNSICQQTVAKRIHTDGVSNLTFQFLPRSDVNAFAFRRNQSAFVATNLGVLSFLLDRGRELVGHPEMRSLFENVVGTGLDRDKLAALIMVCGATFLFAHEVGHHYNAHLYYFRMRQEAMILDESTGATTRGSLESFDRQALELHADSFAVDSTIGNLNDRSWREDAMALLEIQCAPIEAAKLCAMSMAVASSIVFLALRFSKGSDDQQSVFSETDHPAPHHRLLYALSRLSQEDAHASLPPQVIVQLLTIFERAWPGSDLKTWFFRNNDVTKTDVANAYLTALWQRVEELAQELCKHRWR